MKVGFCHTHCYLEIYTFKKTIKLFLGVRKDVFRSLLKSLLSRGWAMFTFLSDAMFLAIFILNVAMFWQKIKVSWTKQGWNMIFHTKFRMLLDWTASRIQFHQTSLTNVAKFLLLQVFLNIRHKLFEFQTFMNQTQIIILQTLLYTLQTHIIYII